MTAGPPIALTIAGSDSSGGAGIQADLKTFSAFGIYGASVLTALTAQNTQGVHGVHAVPPAFVAAQIDAVLADLDVGAIKTGMLANAAIIEAVTARLAASPSIPLVVDPVMVATSGDLLLDPAAVDTLRHRLLPRALLVTPNLPEAARLLGTTEAKTEGEMTEQARALLGLGCGAVLIKGGHGEGPEALDLLVEASGSIVRLVRPRVVTRATHGTGCTLAAAITALLTGGATLQDAVARAKTYVWHALNAGANLGIGRGNGPVDHLYAIKRQPPPA
jgi:hydroxymethylpyrimidine/phosphomethylpyrimidine kinase